MVFDTHKTFRTKTTFPTLKPRCFRTCAVPSYDEDSSNSDWCGLQLKHVTRPEWPCSCRKDSVRGAERGLGPDEWPDCKQYKHITCSYRDDMKEYVFKVKSLILKIYTIQGKVYVFFYHENFTARTPATVRTVRDKLFNNGKAIPLLTRFTFWCSKLRRSLLKLAGGFLANVNKGANFLLSLFELANRPTNSTSRNVKLILHEPTSFQWAK